MKRLAQRIRIPLPIRDFTGCFGYGPTDQQIDAVWIPPSGPEVSGQDVLDDLRLPKPDITFQVGGFDVEVSPGLVSSSRDTIRLRVSMHVMMKGEDRWTTVEASDIILLPREESERDVAWKNAVRRLMVRLLDHEVNESLMFNGEFHIDPHPEQRALRLAPIAGDTLLEMFAKLSDAQAKAYMKKGKP